VLSLYFVIAQRIEIVSSYTLNRNDIYILYRVLIGYVTGNFDKSDEVQFVFRVTYSGIITDRYATSNIKFH
jgi:hypothetical protein